MANYFQNTGFLPAFAKLAAKYRPSGNPILSRQLSRNLRNMSNTF